MERGEGGDFSQLFSTSVLFLKKNKQCIYVLMSGRAIINEMMILQKKKNGRTMLYRAI